MISHRHENGKLRKLPTHLSEAEAALVDSQDARYIGMREQIDKKAVEKATARLHFLDADRPNKHVLFVDEDDVASSGGASGSTAGGRAAASGTGQKPTKKKKKLQDFDVAAFFDTHPALLGKKANRPR